jgi:hypothetical protein
MTDPAFFMAMKRSSIRSHFFPVAAALVLSSPGFGGHQRYSLKLFQDWS